MRISLAGVAIEEILQKSSGNRDQFDKFNPLCSSDMFSAVRYSGKSSVLVNQEYDRIIDVLFNLWPVVEYVAVHILRETKHQNIYRPPNTWSREILHMTVGCG
jgi:hypothetical protein